MPDTREQFLAYLDHLGPAEVIDFSRLETHVVDGAFCPPSREDERIAERRSRRPPPNRHLHDEVVPASLLSYNPDTRTHKTTMRRLAAREHSFNTLITVRDEATGEEARFGTRQGHEDTRRLEHDGLPGRRAVGRAGERLVVVNTDARGREDDVAVVRDGVYWVARFGFSPENRRRVEAAGFRLCPDERRWQTRDARVAAVLDPSLRAEMRRHEAEVEGASAPRRRAVFGRWRR